MTEIIGHRGAKGLAPENTLAAFRAGKQAGADRLELDVRRTRDGQFVVCHDKRLWRVGRSFKAVPNLTYEELQQLPLRGGGTVPLLRDVLKTADKTPVVVEIKITGYTEAICQTVDEIPQLNVWYLSFKRSVVADCKALRPQTRVYLAGLLRPFTLMRTAHQLSADGVCLPHWVLNRFVYRRAARAGLKLYIFTVDQPNRARKLLQRYPGIDLCSNHPERLKDLADLAPQTSTPA